MSVLVLKTASEVSAAYITTVLRRARFKGSWTFVSLHSRLESNKAEENIMAVVNNGL
jgi:hypothetical protein